MQKELMDMKSLNNNRKLWLREFDAFQPIENSDPL